MAFKETDYPILRDIHKRNMARFIYKTDAEQYQKHEYWIDERVLQAYVGTKLVFTGDCEEFARVCMFEAMAAGYRARLVICKLENGEGHCLCEVADPLREQAWYMDNRRTKLVDVKGLAGYQFYAASPWNPMASDARPWVELNR